MDHQAEERPRFGFRLPREVGQAVLGAGDLTQSAEADADADANLCKSLN